MRRLATLILSLWGIALSHAALEIPKALPATDITENSFTANWQSISQASAYNLNVFAYKMEDCGTETVKVTESFEGLVPRSSGSKRNKYIDSNLSVFPENWKIDVNTGSIRQLYTTNVAGDTTSVYSGKIALAFDATGDSIVTPVLPAPASKFSFWIKNANATGTVAVYGFDGFQWHSLGEASTISYRSGGIADFSANIPVGCIQFKMIYTDENPDLNSPTAIDEISYTYGGIVKTRDYLVENKRITETSAPVTGLKDNTDYFYTVNAQLRMNQNQTKKDYIEAGDIRLNTKTTTLYCTKTNEEIEIICKEFQIIEYLIKNPNQVISKEQIYEKIWGLENESESNNLEAYISFIRKKLKSIGSEVQIKAIRGLGYKLEARN